MEIIEKGIQVGFAEISGILMKNVAIFPIRRELRCLRIDAANHQISEMLQEIPKDGRRLLAVLQDVVEKGEGFAAFSLENMMGQGNDLVLPGEAQKVVHRGRVQAVLLRGGGALVQERERIAQAPIGANGDEVRCVVGQGKVALFGDMEQVLLDVFHRNAVEFVALAAGEDGERDFLRLRGGQDEKYMGRRFFQGFQERIEGFLRQHVHFVDDVDLLAAGGWERADGLLQRADLLDAAVRCRVDFIDVQARTAIDFLAILTLVARIRIYGMLAVHCLGKDFRHTGLAGPAGAGEQVGVGQPILLDGPLQGDGNMLLSHHFAESTGTPFAIQSKISHRCLRGL